MSTILHEVHEQSQHTMQTQLYAQLLHIHMETHFLCITDSLYCTNYYTRASILFHIYGDIYICWSITSIRNR